MGWPDGGAPPVAPGSIPSDDPRNAAWRGLLRQSAAILASAPDALRRRLTLGGGSMLALRYGHRESRDLDFFLPDAQLLGFLSPRLNETVAGLAEGYEEASNFLRFTFGAQEVDFIVAAPVLESPTGPVLEVAAGLSVPVERPGEIVAKKMLYRGAAFTHRDVLDLALVQAVEPAELLPIAARLGRRALERLDHRLGTMAEGFDEAARSRLTLRPGFEPLLRDALPIARAAVAAMQARLPS
jgi:hypothetical protein